MNRVERHVCRDCGGHVEGVDPMVIDRAKAEHDRWHEEQNMNNPTRITFEPGDRVIYDNDNGGIVGARGVVVSMPEPYGVALSDGAHVTARAHELTSVDVLDEITRRRGRTP